MEVIAVVEQWPKMEGRQLIMVLAPKKVVVPVKAAPKAPRAPKEASAAAPEAAVAATVVEAPKENPDAVAS